MATYMNAPGWWHSSVSMPNGPYGPPAYRTTPGFQHSTVGAGSPQNAANLSAYSSGVGTARKMGTSAWMARNAAAKRNAGSGGGIGGGPGYDLYGEYQKKLDEANAANEARYNEAKGIYNENINRINQRTEQDRADVDERSGQRSGQIHADAVGRGLGNSSVNYALDSMIERERNADQRRLSDSRIDQMNAAQRELAGVIERKNDIGPDLGQMLGLAQQYGNSGLGGQYSGGGDFSPVFTGNAYQTFGINPGYGMSPMGGLGRMGSTGGYSPMLGGGSVRSTSYDGSLDTPLGGGSKIPRMDPAAIARERAPRGLTSPTIPPSSAGLGEIPLSRPPVFGSSFGITQPSMWGNNSMSFGSYR